MSNIRMKALVLLTAIVLSACVSAPPGSIGPSLAFLAQGRVAPDADDLTQIAAALAKVAVQGARLPASALGMTGH